METTTTPVTTSAAGLRYGLLAGLALIVYSFVLMVTNNEQNGALSSLVYIIMIAGIVLAHRFFKQHHGGFMSYGQGLGIATIAGGIMGLLSGIFRYVYINFIDTQYQENMMNAVRAKLEEAGSMSDEQIEQTMQMTQRFTPTGPLGIVVAALGTAFIAFLLGLIISAITKRNRPEFE